MKMRLICLNRENQQTCCRYYMNRQLLILTVPAYVSYQHESRSVHAYLYFRTTGLNVQNAVPTSPKSKYKDVKPIDDWTDIPHWKQRRNRPSPNFVVFLVVKRKKIRVDVTGVVHKSLFLEGDEVEMLTWILVLRLLLVQTSCWILVNHSVEYVESHLAFMDSGSAINCKGSELYPVLKPCTLILA
jgi:hypothetical protein